VAQIVSIVQQHSYRHRLIDQVILKYAGHDATKAYLEYHAPSVVKDSLSPDCFKGNLDRSTINEQWKQGPVPSNNTQAVPEDEKTPLHNIINLYASLQIHTCRTCLMISSYDFEEAAIKTASKKTFAFYSTAATDCWSRDMNNSMYKRIWFRPRVMKDVAEVDTSSSVLGIPVDVPLFICPTGLAKMINPEGEKALARAAKSSGILEIVSQANSKRCTG
jgi:L-lactate dehydrogenase (cytochrome)